MHLPLNSQIGSNLRRWRRHRGLTQAQLGKAAGISAQQVQKYESGVNSLSVIRLSQLCAILGIGFRDIGIGNEGMGYEPSPELRDLCRWFERIPSPAHRKSIIALAKHLAKAA